MTEEPGREFDHALASQGIALIVPHRTNRGGYASHDGHALRRYRQRWKIERPLLG